MYIREDCLLITESGTHIKNICKSIFDVDVIVHREATNVSKLINQDVTIIRMCSKPGNRGTKINYLHGKLFPPLQV